MARRFLFASFLFLLLSFPVGTEDGERLSAIPSVSVSLVPAGEYRLYTFTADYAQALREALSASLGGIPYPRRARARGYEGTYSCDVAISYGGALHSISSLISQDDYLSRYTLSAVSSLFPLDVSFPLTDSEEAFLAPMLWRFRVSVTYSLSSRFPVTQLS